MTLVKTSCSAGIVHMRPIWVDTARSEAILTWKIMGIGYVTTLSLASMPGFSTTLWVRRSSQRLLSSGWAPIRSVIAPQRWQLMTSRPGCRSMPIVWVAASANFSWTEAGKSRKIAGGGKTTPSCKSIQLRAFNDPCKMGSMPRRCRRGPTRLPITCFQQGIRVQPKA